MLFSDNQVIAKLNAFFVPVFVNNFAYQDVGWQPTSSYPAQIAEGATLRPVTFSSAQNSLSDRLRLEYGVPPAELAAFKRLRLQELALFPRIPPDQFPVGPVHANLTAPDGRVVDVLDINRLSRQALLARLDACLRTLGTRPGKRLLDYRFSPPWPVAPSDLCLQVTARFLGENVDLAAVMRNLDGTAEAEFLRTRMKNPARDWVLLSRGEWRRLLPARLRAGEVRAVEPGLAASLLMHLSPPTDKYHLSRARVDTATLSTRVVRADAAGVALRLEGTLVMRHPWGQLNDGKLAEARVVGIMETDRRARRVRSFTMITDPARYRGLRFEIPFAAAVALWPSRSQK